MSSVVSLYSVKVGEINRFLSSFFNENFYLDNDLEWKKFFDNPVEMSDIVGAFIDNKDSYDANMWVNIDPEISINVTEHNADSIIRYLYERFPY